MQNGGASSPTSGHRRTGVTGRRRRRRLERPREAVGSTGDWSGHGLDQGGERRLRGCRGDAHHGRRWRGTAGILAGGGCPQWRRPATGPHGGGSASVCLWRRGAAEEAWLSTAKIPTASLPPADGDRGEFTRTTGGCPAGGGWQLGAPAVSR
jgi:hypothetical protein